MNGEIGKSFESNPDETLELASAFAKRLTDEHLYEQILMADSLGEPVKVPSPELQIAIATGWSVIALNYIEEPNSTMAVGAIIDVVLNSKTADLIIKESGTEPDEETRLLLKQTVIDTVTTLAEQFGFDGSAQAKKIIKILDSAKTISTTHNVSVTTVFENDNLYEEMFRALYEPADYAREQLGYINLINEDFADKIGTNLLESQIRESLGGEDADETEIQLRLACEKVELSDDIAARDMPNRLIKAAKIVIASQLKRFWGEGVVDALRVAGRHQGRTKSLIIIK